MNIERRPVSSDAQPRGRRRGSGFLCAPRNGRTALTDAGAEGTSPQVPRASPHPFS
jgi:hypothetical protein